MCMPIHNKNRITRYIKQRVISNAKEGPQERLAAKLTNAINGNFEIHSHEVAQIFSYRLMLSINCASCTSYKLVDFDSTGRTNK